jgi:hypothetical protein
MAITIENYQTKLQELIAAGMSIRDDRQLIVFEVGNEKLEYSDAGRFIQNTLGCNNAAIFDLLGLDKYDFCKIAYGHTPSEGDCPEARQNPERSVINLVCMLFDEIKSRELYKPIPALTLEDVESKVLESLEKAEDKKKQSTLKSFEEWLTAVNEIHVEHAQNPQPRAFQPAQEDMFEWDIVNDGPRAEQGQAVADGRFAVQEGLLNQMAQQAVDADFIEQMQPAINEAQHRIVEQMLNEGAFNNVVEQPVAPVIAGDGIMAQIQQLEERVRVEPEIFVPQPQPRARRRSRRNDPDGHELPW